MCWSQAYQGRVGQGSWSGALVETLNILHVSLTLSLVQKIADPKAVAGEEDGSPKKALLAKGEGMGKYLKRTRVPLLEAPKAALEQDGDKDMPLVELRQSQKLVLADIDHHFAGDNKRFTNGNGSQCEGGGCPDHKLQRSDCESISRRSARGYQMAMLREAGLN